MGSKSQLCPNVGDFGQRVVSLWASVSSSVKWEQGKSSSFLFPGQCGINRVNGPKPSLEMLSITPLQRVEVHSALVTEFVLEARAFRIKQTRVQILVLPFSAWAPLGK